MKGDNKLKNLINTSGIKKLLWRIRIDTSRFAFSVKKILRSIGILDSYKDLLELKNKYEGKRCFIIATGPSLTNEDILKLRNEYTFSMNAMCLKYNELNWVPTFYGIQDEKVFHKLKDYIDNPMVKEILVDGRYKKECGNYSNWKFFPRYSSYNSFDAYFHDTYRVLFSDDAHLVVYDGFTITYSLIQIAVYMGFKEIYLLGCDCGYSKDPSKRYFVDHGVVGTNVNNYSERFFAAYKAADEYAKSHNVSIFNATRGGQLEIFPRVDLDNIIPKQ